MATHAVSIIVCTRDRSDQLASCLDALFAQDYSAYEVIVVDNAPSDPQTSRVCAGFPVRYIVETVPGLSRARNRGIREASHQILAFTDDDTLPDPFWLAALDAAFADPAVMAVTGRVEAAELGTEAQRLFEVAAGGMSKGSEPIEFHRERMSSTELIAVQAVGVGANMAFRRIVFERVGPFDDRLGAGTPARGADDLEMFHRVLAAGMLLRYEPAALVMHRHRPDVASLSQQLYDSGCGFGVYLCTLLENGTASRASVFRHAFGQWLPWLVWRAVKGMAGRHPLPTQLMRAQLAGGLHALTAYRSIGRKSE